jgi:glycosyltransferase involved in cell wall biosynthesis
MREMNKADVAYDGAQEPDVMVSCVSKVRESRWRAAAPAPLPILFMTDLLCRENELGGAERVLLRILKSLPRERYSPRVITFRLDEGSQIADLLGCPLHVLPLDRTYGWGALRVARSIRKIVHSYGIQITHTFHETSDLWGGVIAKMSGCPILVSSRRDMGIQRQKKHRLAYKLLGRYFDQVQTVSEEVRRFSIREDGLEPRRVVTIHNGIDVPNQFAGSERPALRAQFGLSPTCPLVVSVGNIRHVKGVDILLRTAAKVCEVMPDAMFVIAGEHLEPRYAEELTKLVAQLGMASRFRFLGGLDDVTSLLHCADVFCLLSRSEGLSNALLEAMACALPCVATRVGGNSEVVIEGKTGYLVDRENVDRAATSLLQLLQSPSLARRMGFEGRKVVEQEFTTETMMRSLLESYQQLLAHCSA